MLIYIICVLVNTAENWSITATLNLISLAVMCVNTLISLLIRFTKIKNAYVETKWPLWDKSRVLMSAASVLFWTSCNCFDSMDWRYGLFLHSHLDFWYNYNMHIFLYGSWIVTLVQRRWNRVAELLSDSVLWVNDSTHYNLGSASLTIRHVCWGSLQITGLTVRLKESLIVHSCAVLPQCNAASNRLILKVSGGESGVI